MSIPNLRRAISLLTAIAVSATSLAQPLGAAELPYFRFKAGASSVPDKQGDGGTDNPTDQPPTPAMTVAASVPSPGRVGTPYLGFLRASKPAAFAADAGSQAIPGVALAADGRFAGTPSAAGTYQVAYVATAADGSRGTGTVSVTIVEAVAGVPVTAYASLPATGQVGVPYSGKVESSGADAPSYSLASGGVPGLTLGRDGTYSGIPTTAGSYPVSVRVTSASDNASAATAPVTVTIAPDPGQLPIAVSASLPGNAQVNRMLTGALSSTGATSPTYAYADGSDVVPGLAIEGGRVSGYPTRAGDYSVSFKVTSADGRSATSNPVALRIDSYGELTIDDSGAPRVAAQGTALEEYAYYLRYDDRQFMYPAHYSLASGSLPPGLSLSDDGTFSGTPTQAGTFPVRYQARMDDGRTALSEPGSIVVKAPGDATFSVSANLPLRMPAGRKVRYYDERAWVPDPGYGYDADYALPYTISHEGTLPPGVTLDADGYLDGTATTPGTYRVTYVATLKAGGATGRSPEYTYVVDGALQVSVDRTRSVSVVRPGDRYDWDHTRFGVTIGGGTGPFTVVAEVVDGLPLAHADPEKDAWIEYEDRQREFFYTQRETNDRTLRFCATDADGAKACTTNVSMRWQGSPFSWTVQMDDAAPTCAAGRIPFSYVVSVTPPSGTYTLRASIGGTGGEDHAARTIQPLGNGTFRVSGVMNFIGGSRRADDVLVVTNDEAISRGAESAAEQPTFYPQFGDCDKDAMLGGPMTAFWQPMLTTFDATDYPNGIAIQSVVVNAFEGAVLVVKPVKEYEECYSFDYEIPDANGDRPPWQQTRNVYLFGVNGSPSDCHGGPHSGRVQFTFMDGLGRTAVTPAITLGGW